MEFFMDKFKNVLLYVWQLPQNLIGFIWTRFAKTNKTVQGIKAWFTPCFGAGVSLGSYIIFDNLYQGIDETTYTTSLLHEHGHQIQSKRLGGVVRQ